MLGGMTADLDNESDFGKYIIDYANEITGGAYPVMFLRGEGESKGAFAANLSRFIRPMTSELVTHKLHVSTTFGSNYSLIGLDTAANKADNDSSYNGYAAFTKIRQEQAEWLESLPKSFAGKYNLVFANSSNLSDCFGVDFTKNFSTLKVQLAVTGGSGAVSFKDGGAGYSQVVVGDSLGVVITCAKDTITVEDLTDDKTTIGTVEIADVTYNKGEIKDPSTPSTPSTPGKPSKPNEKPSDGPDEEEPGEDDPDEEDPKGDGAGNYDDDDDDDKTDSSKPGSSDFDSSISIQEVADDWYEDYLYYNVDIADGAKFKLDADVAEGDFIYVVTRLAGANLTVFSGDSAIDSAAEWAKQTGLTTKTLSGSDNIKSDTAKSIIEALVG